MKNLFIVFLSLAVNFSYGQSQKPDFIVGTWKMEKQEIYEHWDKINSSTFKGFSYRLNKGQMEIIEYLQISSKNNHTILTATVLNQNNGKALEFKGANIDNLFTFENSNHDFPKKITYQKLLDTEILVTVSDGKQKNFSNKMFKLNVKDTSIANTQYDKILAEKLGGDEYGMKKYHLVVLKTGKNNSADKTLINESFKGHMENINKLVEEGKLIVAGPLAKNEKTYRGIFIINNIKSSEELQNCEWQLRMHNFWQLEVQHFWQV